LKRPDAPVIMCAPGCVRDEVTMANDTDRVARRRARQEAADEAAAEAARAEEREALRDRQRDEIASLVPEVLALLAARGYPDLVELQVWRNTVLGRRHDERGGYPVCKFSNTRKGVRASGRLYLLSDGQWLFGEANDARSLDDRRMDPLLADVLRGLDDLLRRHG
jgi:hypothetical protein